MSGGKMFVGAEGGSSFLQFQEVRSFCKQKPLPAADIGYGRADRCPLLAALLADGKGGQL